MHIKKRKNQDENGNEIKEKLRLAHLNIANEKQVYRVFKLYRCGLRVFSPSAVFVNDF